MFEVVSQIHINAPIETVWTVLTDVAAYKDWSTMLHYEGGTLQQGEQIKLRLALPGGTNYSFSPTVVRLEHPHTFMWHAKTGINGIFDGKHSFELTALSKTQTQLVNREVYSGLLSPIFKRLPMMKDAQAGFDAMNTEIKTQAERNH